MPPPIAILSDPHGNSPALRAVLAEIDSLGCEQIYVLGDIPNGPDPSGCVDLLRARPDMLAVKGNADHYILTPDLESFPLRHESFYPELLDFLFWIRAQLTPDQMAWLASLPDLLYDSGSCFCHDSPLDRLFPHNNVPHDIDPKYHELCYHSNGINPQQLPGEWDHLLVWMDSQHIQRVFIGHSHSPIIYQSGEHLVVNVGSAGFALDGDPRPSWVLVDETGTPTIRRVDYDIEEAIALMDTTGYMLSDPPNKRAAYQKMLRTGLHWRVHLSA